VHQLVNKDFDSIGMHGTTVTKKINNLRKRGNLSNLGSSNVTTDVLTKTSVMQSRFPAYSANVG
jgi:hypothetical protein